MTYLLNSAVLAAGAYGAYTYEPAAWSEVAAALAGRFESRIGYPETAALIERHTGVRPAISRESSALEPGDEAYVVRLRYRVAEPGAKGSHTGAEEAAWEVARLTRVA